MNKFFFRIFLSFLFLFNLNINILSSNNIILDDNSKTWTNVVKEFSYTVALCTVTCATSMIIWHFLEKLLFSKKEDELSTFIKKENKKLNNIETSSNTLIQSPSDFFTICFKD
jgi:cell division protein FtsL